MEEKIINDQARSNLSAISKKVKSVILSPRKLTMGVLLPISLFLSACSDDGNSNKEIPEDQRAIAIEFLQNAGVSEVNTDAKNTSATQEITYSDEEILEALSIIDAKKADDRAVKWVVDEIVVACIQMKDANGEFIEKGMQFAVFDGYKQGGITPIPGENGGPTFCNNY